MTSTSIYYYSGNIPLRIYLIITAISRNVKKLSRDC